MTGMSMERLKSTRGININIVTVSVRLTAVKWAVVCVAVLSTWILPQTTYHTLIIQGVSHLHVGMPHQDHNAIKNIVKILTVSTTAVETVTCIIMMDSLSFIAMNTIIITVIIIITTMLVNQVMI